MLIRQSQSCLVAALLLLPLLCLPVFGASPGGVTGTVQDAAGDPIEGARLTLTSASGEALETLSDGNGRFAFERVEPGEHGLRVESRTHQPCELPVSVTDEAPRPLKIQLKVGLAEEVSVTGVDPDNDKTATNNNADVLEFDDRLIQGLPAPPNSSGLLDFAAGYISPASQGTDGVTIVVDGADSGAMPIPASAIKRIKVNRHPYSAEFRRPGKARLDVKTQDGSRRRFEGSAAIYVQNSALAWQNAFASSKPNLNRQLFDLSFSGPLSPKLGSFFLSVQREVIDEDVIVNAQTLDGPVNELVPSKERFTSALARLDLRAGLHRFGVRYNYGRETRFNRGVGGLRLPESAFDSRRAPQHSVQVWAKSILSASYVNDARLTLMADSRRDGEPAHGPAINVNGAFAGGSSQAFRSNRRLLVEAREVGTYVRGAHTILFGAGFRNTSVDETDASGFGGVFEFASLDDFALGKPYVYRVSQGTPDLSFAYRELEAFVQDEVKLRSDLTLMAGLRYDHTSAIEDRNNVAARLSGAWSPGQGKTVWRAGLGVFYERLPSSALERQLLWDGERIQKLVITNPAYPDPLLGGDTTTHVPSIFRLAHELTTPYVFQGTIATEREVSPRARITVEYGFVRGLHLFRGRDVNAPLPGTGARPDLTHGEIVEAESSGSLRSHSVNLTYRGRIGRRVKAQAQYTIGWARNDVGSSDAGFPFDVAADSHDLRPEWGRADFDRRHSFSLAGMAELPWRINAGVTVGLRSPEPYDITTGRDDNGDGRANDRPVGVTRNTGQGPEFFQVDVRLSKGRIVTSPFKGDRQKPSEVQLVIDAHNLTNRVNYSQYIGVMTSPFFGSANSAKEARSLQLALRYRF